MPPEVASWLIPVIVAVLGAGGAGGLIAWRTQIKREPIDEETAAVLNAKTAGELALAVAKQQGDALVEQADSIRMLREDLSTLRAEYERTRSILDVVGQWARDLHDGWAKYRLRDEPPGGLPPGFL